MGLNVLRVASRLALLGLGLCHASLCGAELRVNDTLSLTRIAGPSVRLARGDRPLFIPSPDGKSVAAVRRQGNALTGRIEYALVFIDATEVVDFIHDGKRSRPNTEYALARFSISPELDDGIRNAIDEVDWLPDSHGVAFIGRGDDGIGQVYTLDIRTRQLRQLTRHPDDIATFALSPAQDVLMFSAFTPPDWRERNMRGYVVAPEELPHYLGKVDPKEIAQTHIRYFIQHLDDGRTINVDMESGYLLAREISISPDGARAVVASTIRDLPSHWAQYSSINSNPMRVPENSPSLHFKDAFGQPSFQQYRLVDLQTGRVRPLIDAPTDMRGKPRARWSPDGQRVLLPPTYLPLATSRSNHDVLLQQPALIEVDLAAGAVRRVPDFIASSQAEDAALPIVDMGWQGGSELWVCVARSADDYEFIQFRRRSGRWSKVSSSAGALPAGVSRLQLKIKQEMNQAPALYGLDLRTGREGKIAELNPQLDSLNLPPVEPFTWKDRLNREFTGGLFKPQDYTTAQRYPVVIQGGGFSPQVFSLEGPPQDGAAPYAARLLATRGILVLQIPRMNLRDQKSASTAFEDSGETPLYVAQIEGAIDALDRANLIDRNKVGLVGFSRDGMYVHYALTFSKYPIAAATVADSICLSPWCYSLYYGAPYPRGMNYWDEPQPEYNTIGAPFWGAGVGTWLERSYLFHLDRVRTPIRYESYGAVLPTHWEQYAILKRHERPVEMVRIPIGEHVIRAPFGLRTSKEGNVDWFDFWLNGHEDSDPTKSDQYDRWRRLRQQHEAVQRERLPPIMRWTPAKEELTQ